MDLILLERTPTNNNRTISDIQRIIDQLDKVKNGTTVYAKAQELKYFANKKLQDLQSNSQS